MTTDSMGGPAAGPRRIVVNIGIGTEFDGSIASSSSMQIENLAIVQADVPIQIEWLDDFSEILRQLRPCLHNEVLLDKVERIIDEMRIDRNGREPQQDRFRALCVRAAPLLRTLTQYVINFVGVLAEQEAKDKLLELISSFLR